MNIEFLQTLVIEELRNLCDADSQLSEMLPKMERASLSSEVEKAIHRRRELEQNQTGCLVGILARFEVTPGGGQCHSMRGLLEEAEEVLRRESGVYPARLEPRLLGVLRKAGHLRIAALKCMIAIVHLLEAKEIEHTLADCLCQEIEADQFISALADDELRLIVANSIDETTSALETLKQYA
jgi:ferritin-like metal-binding protein YciE